jgi:hypothetical protein
VEKKVITKRRRLSRDEGPFRFFYVAVYRIEEGESLWKLVSFSPDGFLSVKPFNQFQKNELVKKHGTRAYAIISSVAKNGEREEIPEDLFKNNVQLQLI